MLAKAQNVSAIVDPKSVKGVGKHMANGVAVVPVELLDFGQLLGDSAQLLGETNLAAPALDSALPIEEERAVELVLADVPIEGGAAQVAEAPAAVSLVQAWQGWLDGATRSVATTDQIAGEPEGDATVPGDQSKGLKGSMGPAGPTGAEVTVQQTRESRVAPGVTALQTGDPQGNEKFSQQLTQSGELLGKAAAGKPEVLARKEGEATASANEIHSAFGVTHAEVRKASAAVPQMAIAHINVPLRAPEWSSSFSEQIVVLAHGGGGRAELRLNPAELGPIDVSLNVQDDRVQAAFTIHHAATLEAVQAALPKLEQMLAERGVQLDSVSVDSKEGDSQRDARNANAGSGESGRGGRGAGAQHEDTARRVLVRKGLVDTFA